MEIKNWDQIIKKKYSGKEKYLRLTEETNALDYLKQAYQFILQTEKNKMAWKWVVISLHGALYGFAICALKGTNWERVTYKTKRGHKLISFDKAIEYCQDYQRMHMTTETKLLQLSDAQKESIKILKDTFRNPLEHYIPLMWKINIHMFPQMAINILDIIRFLALDTGNCIHLSQFQQRRIKSIVFQGKRVLKQSKSYQEYRLAIVK